MSLTPNPLPDQLAGESASVPAASDGALAAPEQAVSAPEEKPFPAWSGWDVAATLVLTLLAIFVFTVAALLVAHSFPAYRHAPFTDLTTNAKIVIAAQATAYPVVLIFIFLMVRSRSRQRFAMAIRWRWPGAVAPAFMAGGVVLAIVVEGLARFLPIPKSLPMDTYFHDATSAYMMAAFGITLAPLLEELFFRGLLYPLLDRAFGVVVGVLLTAAGFAAIHGAQLGYAWAPVLSIFVVGVVFTVVRVRTKSVASCFLMHCGYNLALFTALWLGSDHFRHLEKVAG
ncbi:MAG TPA: type II CAAX endopeptidase family protein [Candidatus Binatia bacterium]|nr:type II CAAX endopeptidase family protein [Candidatus Binatia bacterium]